MIILFGMAGSGKGTQGKALSEIFGWRWLSNGELIRQSGKYKEIIDRGKLIPDDDVNKMMDGAIKKAEAEGFDVVLDGYPRDKAQADYVVEHFADRIDGAIILEVPKEELYERLSLRGRDDDKEKSSIDRRFAVFEQNLAPILSALESKNIPVEHVNGVGPIDEVTARLVPIVKNFNPNATEQKDDVNGEEIEKSYGE